MNILHVIPNLNKGGAERIVIDIIREINKRSDQEIRLVIFRDEIEYDVSDIKHLIYVVPSSIQLSIWKTNSYSIHGLQSFMDDFKPDIIHSHLFEADFVCSSCFYPNAKWFAHYHGNIRQFEKFQFKSAFIKKKLTDLYEEKYLLKRRKLNDGIHIIAISNLILKSLKKSAPHHKITLLHNAIDYDTFYKEKQYTIDSNNKLTLINIGSLSKNKNQLFLLRVAKILQEKQVNFEIHFLGDGKILADLKETKRSMNLEGIVHFHGSVMNVEHYLWKSDIYVHAAKSEAFGMTLVEAMASGLPAIILDGGGNRDLIEQGKNGFIFNEENAEEFAEQILKLWNDKNEYQRLSLYSQEFAKAFDIKKYVTTLLEIYKA